LAGCLVNQTIVAHLRRTDIGVARQGGLGAHPRGFENREPDFWETSVPGILAAGDVCATSTKQVASAAGKGAAALKIRGIPDDP